MSIARRPSPKNLESSYILERTKTTKPIARFHLQMLADLEMKIEMIDILLVTIIKSQVRYEERIPPDAKRLTRSEIEIEINLSYPIFG
jgi:hypothetical protein